MKIKKIEFENFRNFRDRGEILCSTDGKITIIYGKNGDGKTTLHQLLQWIIYNETHFNNTATRNLYNHEYERSLAIGESFHVWGSLDFEHENTDYTLIREYKYKKGLLNSEKVGEELTLLKRTNINDWIPLNNPKDLIEKMLPSGLSEYFFFDGESMIADLRVKGKDSALKLRKSLFSMFDLDTIESAINHIGRTDLKTTVMGKLYLSKGTIASGEISAMKIRIENVQVKVDQYEKDLRKNNLEKKQSQNYIAEISERIGKTKSKAEYEKLRKDLIKHRDEFAKNADIYQGNFGDAIVEMFPQLFISKAVEDAKQRINLKIEKSKMPHGLSKALVEYLLSGEIHECICGNHLGEAELVKIGEYLEMMPPKSYTSLYDDFNRTAERWGNGYNIKVAERYIRMVLDNRESASDLDKQLKDLDEEYKNAPDIGDLVVERQKAESRIEELDEEISKLEIEKKKHELILKRLMKEFDDLTKASREAQKVNHQLDIMSKVAEHFVLKLENASSRYSRLLKDNIQSLMDRMLTSRRRVEVSKDFAVRITDSFDDESKSEGQFAVISFAYIGGILQMLKTEEALANKEYPLVLDGPFSKLDEDQRQNVANTIGEFAPQVILFSKDDLQSVFNPEVIGMVYTIDSNEEKNIASIKEGFLWK